MRLALRPRNGLQHARERSYHPRHEAPRRCARPGGRRPPGGAVPDSPGV